MPPISDRYYLGRLCHRGHVAKDGKTRRYTSNFQCVQCVVDKYLKRKAKKKLATENRYGDPHE